MSLYPSSVAAQPGSCRTMSETPKTGFLTTRPILSTRIKDEDSIETDIKWASSCENLSSAFPTRSDTNRAAQPLGLIRCLKFRIKEVEGLYYLCSENQGADQLCGYRTADLRLCFRICKNPVFS